MPIVSINSPKCAAIAYQRMVVYKWVAIYKGLDLHLINIIHLLHVKRDNFNDF